MKILLQLFYIFLLFVSFKSIGQSNFNFIALTDNQSPFLSRNYVEFDTNLISSVMIELDKKHNAIIFATKKNISGVNITVKQREEKVIIQKKGVTIKNNFSIFFPPQATKNQYTVILQKDNHILVKRLKKEW